MSETQRIPEETQTLERILLPSLITSYFVVLVPMTLTRLLLIDIGNTFSRSVGVTGQITTVASLVTAISAVFMGAWSVRFDHKSLLLWGLLFLCISAIGCFLAWNFPMMLITYAISGLGLGIVEPMVYTLVGAHFPLKKRPRAFGWLLTGAVLALLSAPVIGIIAGIGGWRWAFLGFVLPIALLGLILASKGVSSQTQSADSLMDKSKYWEGFKEVFSNRSATACLMGSLLAMSAWQAIALYSIAFFREQFQLSMRYGSLIILGTALSYLVGSQISSRFVSKFGMKPVTLLTIFFASIFIIAFTTVPHLGLALTFIFISCFFFGMRATAASSLTLEQVPRFRGSMMSMNSAAWFLGFALGAGLGGAALLRFNYGVLGLVLGTTGLIAALFFYGVNDPTKPLSATRQ